MTATFLLPLAIGACNAVEGGNVVEDAFGVIAMVAMTPLIAIQILGLVYKIKQSKARKPETVVVAEENGQISEQITIDFDSVAAQFHEAEEPAVVVDDDDIIDF